jgi:hypothetical protein
VSLADHPKLAAAEQAAEKSISRAQPKLPKATVHKITVKAFQARLLEENTASFRDPAESTP